VGQATGREKSSLIPRRLWLKKEGQEVTRGGLKSPREEKKKREERGRPPAYSGGAKSDDAISNVHYRANPRPKEVFRECERRGKKRSVNERGMGTKGKDVGEETTFPTTVLQSSEPPSLKAAKEKEAKEWKGGYGAKRGRQTRRSGPIDLLD